ncbi:MAG: hypothetical protein K8S18_09865 [Desulfobacula sp.]|nr:hypothetical protein [Desulfobacula sp.]
MINAKIQAESANRELLWANEKLEKAVLKASELIRKAPRTPQRQKAIFWPI